MTDLIIQGIGKATAFSFARHGVRQLSLADIDLGAAQQTVNDIESRFPGVKAVARKVDVQCEASINTAVADTVSQLGRIDYAVNSAGVGGPLALSADHEVEGWTKTLDIDLTGVWLSSRAEIRAMLQQKRYEEYVPPHGLLKNRISDSIV
jgi:NAD(P)-dependent dehydrogenase (short-subunit alcohol dehydrogenase family)